MAGFKDHEVLRLIDATPECKLVYAMLISHADGRGITFIGVETLAWECGLARSTTYAALAWLADHGAIRKVETGGAARDDGHGEGGRGHATRWSVKPDLAKLNDAKLMRDPDDRPRRPQWRKTVRSTDPLDRQNGPSGGPFEAIKGPPDGILYDVNGDDKGSAARTDAQFKRVRTTDHKSIKSSTRVNSDDDAYDDDLFDQPTPGECTIPVTVTLTRARHPAGAA